MTKAAAGTDSSWIILGGSGARVLQLAQLPELSSIFELTSLGHSSGFQAQSSSGHLKNEFKSSVWKKSFLFSHTSHAGKANPALSRTRISALSLNQKH